jgi:hypothetical protein
MPKRPSASALTILDLATEDEYFLFHFARHVGDLNRAREAMIDLLRDGHVEIRVRQPARPGRTRTLDGAEAERALRNDANWFDPNELLTPVSVLAVATSTGEALYFRQRKG